MDKGVDSDQGAVEPSDLTVKQAALIAGCSVKTLRRAIHGTTAPGLPMHYVDAPSGAQIMIRRVDLEQWQRERAGHVTTLDNAVTTGQDGVDTVHAVQPYMSTGLVAELVATIADLSRENGRLQAEIEHLRAIAAPQHPPAVPPVAEPTPTPTARPTPSARTRLSVWLGLRSLKNPRNRVF